ncbi:vitamin K epoxide reductase complex subunit 1-like protein 1 [Pomacea canaliculata]|uniref:vitamin K epoxide reductase complex subunit 1-like protein 1 n=1 Tax=Pomacea canaliculata TaxID=400727 RepID=UPI000D731917|nr:vitamin K epoxide reductase complex subunit 1-like protein 1 [Pomacea canaliculata]XP_025092337.1 vitamin K epoxide reductase complex subunit 1-like protein 1 [Pomacea canaliculata]
MAGPAYVIISNMADRLLLSLAGLLVSVYSLHVEVQKEKNPKYRAACDFSERMSCSKVLTSKYSRGFGVVEPYLGKKHFLNVRNCNLGIVFYLVHAALALLLPAVTAAPLLLLLSVAGVVTSLYLGYILFVVMNDVCVVCITTYVINGLLLYLSYSLYSQV